MTSVLQTFVRSFPYSMFFSVYLSGPHRSHFTELKFSAGWKKEQPILERVYKVEYPHVVIAAYLAYTFVNFLFLFLVHPANVPLIVKEQTHWEQSRLSNHPDVLRL